MDNLHLPILWTERSGTRMRLGVVWNNTRSTENEINPKTSRSAQSQLLHKEINFCGGGGMLDHTYRDTRTLIDPGGL